MEQQKSETPQKRLTERQQCILTWCAIALIVFLSLIPVQHVAGDDLVYGEQLKHLGWWGWYSKQLATWSGRAFSEAMTATFLPASQWLWRLANTAFICLLIYSLAHLAFRNVNAFSYDLSFCAFWLIPPAVMINTTYWTIGSFYYTWPMALALFSAILLLRSYRGQTTKLSWLYIIAALCASLGVEQIGPCLFAFSVLTVISLLHRKKTVPINLWIYTAVVTAGLTFQVFAPGTKQRTPHEIAHWYPDFGSLSFAQKISRGLSWQYNYFSSFLLPLIILLSISALINYLIHRYSGQRDLHVLGTRYPTLLTVSISTTITALVLILSSNAYRTNFSAFEHGMAALRSPRAITSYALWTLFAIALLISVLLLSDEPWVDAFLFLAGCASAALMYISPTIYASGARTLFVSAICFILVILRQCARSREKMASLLCCTVALVNFLNFMCVIFSSGYSNRLFS